MGRVRDKKINSGSQADINNSTENKAPPNRRQKNPRKAKENIAVGLNKDDLKPSANIQNNRCVLSDKTISTLNEINPKKKITFDENNTDLQKPKEKSRNNTKNKKKPLTSPQNQQLKKSVILDDFTNSNALSNKENNIVPIYKQNQDPCVKTKKVSLPVEQKIALYEFDETDDSDGNSAVVKKKRKKRKYNKRKYLIGPKYLTINNIKFSSSESINSLTDKPPVQKSRKALKAPSNIQQKEPSVKRQSQSMVNLNDTRNTCVSSASYRSQPLLQNSYNDSHNFHDDLSIINENEHSKSKDEVSYSFTDVPIQCTSPLSHTYGHQNISLESSLNNKYILQDNNQALLDIQSSTPCKSKTVSNEICSDRFAVRDGILTSDDEFHGFDEQFHNSKQYNDDCNFGFDIDEKPEEPLLSPIKKNNSDVLTIVDNKPEPLPVMSVREIVQLLQAEQKAIEEPSPSSSVIEESTNSEEGTSTWLNTFATTDCDIVDSFTKPPRKSYTRHPTHHYSFFEEHETSENEDTIKLLPKRKPKVKGKKEEAEANKLAEMLNSKFLEVDKFNLCVE